MVWRMAKLTDDADYDAGETFEKVSTYQMIILMKFNQQPRYTYEELARETGIPDRDLMRSLMALALAKPTQRFLCKEPRSKDIGPQDVFFVNDSFASKHYKIKVTNITVKETEPEQQETRALVDENRRFAIDATIVRVMKARKTLSHNELLAEVVEKLMNHFKPTPPVIKSRIEALIEREFIARCPEDKRIYKYLT
ncbi:unnamed protein product [Protopolystoma xenopodis]|uniref:Cullin family profile domain-containing protein n=1 Tax=Protopolystoma xenopodis TaxID=117903 RepID=A0A448W9T8_9PLAT|nr:unnamed protein product [Protopolystoma xenopodis]